MRKSLKHIDIELRKYVAESVEISSIDTGFKESIIASDIDYPFMNVTYDGNVEFLDGEVTIAASILFLDRLLGDKSNEIEVMSDTMLMAYDFFAKLNSNEREYSFIFENGESTLEPITDGFDDIAVGYRMDATFKLRGVKNELQIPK